MEKIGFERAMARWEEKGFQCKVLKYPYIDHQFNVWYLTKKHLKETKGKKSRLHSTPYYTYIVNEHTWDDDTWNDTHGILDNKTTITVLS